MVCTRSSTVGQFLLQTLSVYFLVVTQVIYELDKVLVLDTPGPELVEADSRVGRGDFLAVDHLEVYFLCI